VIAAVLASRNRHKLDELRAVLTGWQIEPLDRSDGPEESGATYADNALLKARFGRALTDPSLWVIGEDSGIECDALGGEPGLHSARWAAGRDEADALLERLAGETNRRARMVSVLVCLSPELGELHAEGSLEGEIASSRRGEAGFGYDPIFVPAGYATTVAELGEQWKERNSHRALAARALDAAVSAAPGD
jgi:XTP/dITP diphosphohydrolase